MAWNFLNLWITHPIPLDLWETHPLAVDNPLWLLRHSGQFFARPYAGTAWRPRGGNLLGGWGLKLDPTG